MNGIENILTTLHQLAMAMIIGATALLGITTLLLAQYGNQFGKRINNGLSTSVICGVIALVLICFWYIGVIENLVAAAVSIVFAWAAFVLQIFLFVVSAIDARILFGKRGKRRH